MKREATTTLSLAAMSIALMTPGLLQAQSSAIESQPAITSSGMQLGEAEAMQMVSARVALRQTVDADKVKPGDQIRTSLSGKVHLKNGTELPSGTVILGVVTSDGRQMSGTSRLALDFNEAELKNGRMIPIKARIVALYPPASEDAEGNPLMPGDQEVETWTNRSNAVDEINALPGVDLHSNVASNESGVLVSTSKRDVKLNLESEIVLAVAEEPTSGE
jgi:hypothetical protein